MSERKYPHFKNCRCGESQIPLTPDHEWFLNAPNYHNCFWTYIRHNSRSHTLQEIANGLGLSLSAITTIERKAMQKYRRKVLKLMQE